MRLLFKISFLFAIPVVLSGQAIAPPYLVTDEEDPYFGTIAWSLENFHTTDDLKWEDAAASSFLRVYTENPQATEDLPAMLGRYHVNGGQVYFQARFPFLAGRSYWVWYCPKGVPKTQRDILEIRVPANESLKAPKVQAIYPSGPTWPANQLKFYIYFDQPMRSGFSMDALQLRDENGQIVQAPFLDIGEELWDVDQRRLTVWFDPGRIKTLLIPNLEKGPPLYPNRTYQLVLKKDWMASNGLQLAEDYVKVFRTGPKDKTIPKAEEWAIISPAAHTTTPLSIHFPEAMDIALLSNGIGVLDASGTLIEGEIVIGAQEKTWHWHPKQSWTKGIYTLRVSTDLEDLAGNNLQRLFDESTENRSEAIGQRPFVDLEIAVHAP